MTNDSDFVYTQEWLEQKLAVERQVEEASRQAEKEDRDRQDLREAYLQQHGVEPTEAEIAAALEKKRIDETVAQSQYNQDLAARQLREGF